MIIIVIVVALFAALGVVFYKNYIAKTNDTSSKSASSDLKPTKKESTVVEVAGTDMMRYTNYDLGFQFDFPKQIPGRLGCSSSDTWKDTYGNTVKSPVTTYSYKDGIADMTVIEAEHTFTVVQKQAPLLTTGYYGNDERSYFDSCKMVDVTKSQIDKDMTNDDVYLATEMQSWDVYTASSPDDIAHFATKLGGMPTENIASVESELGRLEAGRQEVKYKFTFDKTEGGYGGSVTKTWYYPKEKLLVNISLGHSPSFAKPNSTDSYYIDDIIDSFKPIN